MSKTAVLGLHVKLLTSFNLLIDQPESLTCNSVLFINDMCYVNFANRFFFFLLLNN